MSAAVAACRPSESLNDAARKMWEHDCGALPVVDELGGAPIGIVTDRDLFMHAYVKGGSLDELQVQGAMAGAPATCSADAPLAEAHEMMRALQVHRLPVVDGQGRLEGIIALADLARAQQAEPTAPKRRKAAEELALTVAAIRHPRIAPERVELDVVLDPQPRKPRAAKKATAKKTSAGKKKTARKAAGRGRRA